MCYGCHRNILNYFAQLYRFQLPWMLKQIHWNISKYYLFLLLIPSPIGGWLLRISLIFILCKVVLCAINLLTGEFNFGYIQKCVHTASNYFKRMTGLSIKPMISIAATKYIVMLLTEVFFEKSWLNIYSYLIEVAFL